MSHPFGDLLSQYLHRKHGLSQSKLAAGILQDPAVIGKMCKGQRLTGPQARERVLAIIGWLCEQVALETVAEANALLEAAGMAPLRGSAAVEAALLRQLGTLHATHHQSCHVMAPPSFPAREEEVAGGPGSAPLVSIAHPRNGEVERLNPGVSHLFRLSTGYSIPARPKHNLPAQTTPLIGREQELTQLADLLADPATRLVAILSAGGMGKSHLAVAAALNQVAQFADGVCWVALARLTEANEIGFAIGTALGLQFEGGRTPEQQVGDFLQAKHLLLVLDNFEHLMEGASLVGDLLAKAPRLAILVTSRQRLKLSSETVMLLDGLRFSAEVGPDAFAYPAVQLFVQHARRLRPGYQPDQVDLVGIVEICRLVDGIPLGILLAAAWTGVISPPEIAAEIGKDLGFLQSDMQDIPSRQSNLRTVFLHTWSRLSAVERTVFMRLSVFRSGTTREATQRVTGATIDVLAALTDKALLWRLPTGRYELHELLRQFAAEQLAADDASQGGRQRQAELAHSHYYLSLLGEQEQPLQGQQQRAAVDLIRADFENISVAWRWAVQQREVALLAPAIHALFLYCEVRGIYHEGVILFAIAAVELASATAGSTTSQAALQPLLGQVLVRLGACEVWVDSHVSAENHLQRGLPYSTDDREKAFALTFLGLAAVERGELSIGRERLQASLALSRQGGDRSGMARALLLQNWCIPELTDAIRNCEESLTLWREEGRADRIVEVLGLLAWHTCSQGDYEKAISYWQETMELCNMLGMQLAIAWTLDCLGWAAWCQGDLATAQTYLQDAADLYGAIGMPSSVAMCLADLAVVLRSAGEIEQAVTVAHKSVAIARDTDNQMRLIVSLNYLGAALIGAGDVVAARQALLEAIPLAWAAYQGFLVIGFYYFAELLVLESYIADLPGPLERRSLAVALLSCVRTQTVTWQIFKDKAAQLQVEIEGALPIELFSAAVQRGKSCTLQEMMNALLGDEPNNFSFAQINSESSN